MEPAGVLEQVMEQATVVAGDRATSVKELLCGLVRHSEQQMQIL